MSIIVEIIGWALLMVLTYIFYTLGLAIPAGLGQRQKPGRLHQRLIYPILVVAAVSKIFWISSIWLAVGIWLVLGVILGYMVASLFVGKSPSKGDSRVGPLIYAICEKVDSRHRASLKKHLSRAPSNCEIVAAYPATAPELVQTILSSFQQLMQQLLPRDSAVVGAEVFPDGFAIYMKGNIPPNARDVLVSKLQGIKVGDTPPSVLSGYVSANQLRDLP